MKYKIGDKVILIDYLDTVAWPDGLGQKYNDLNPKIVTIEIVCRGYYEVEELSGSWYDDEIIELYTEPAYEPINSRFEILDL
jgi:hypothetical protein